MFSLKKKNKKKGKFAKKRTVSNLQCPNQYPPRPTKIIKETKVNISIKVKFRKSKLTYRSFGNLGVPELTKKNKERYKRSFKRKKIN